MMRAREKFGRASQVLCSGIVIALIGACSHGGVKRGPASVSGDSLVHTADFTLVHDEAVDRLVRVYSPSPSTRATQVSVSHPGNVSCQIGMPESIPDTGLLSSEPFTFEPTEDQEIYCY